jgi:hypothetical protein
MTRFTAAPIAALVVAALALAAAALAASSEDDDGGSGEPTLVARAILSSDAYEPGPP